MDESSNFDWWQDRPSNDFNEVTQTLSYLPLPQDEIINTLAESQDAEGGCLPNEEMGAVNANEPKSVQPPAFQQSWPILGHLWQQSDSSFLHSSFDIVSMENLFIDDWSSLQAPIVPISNPSDFDMLQHAPNEMSPYQGNTDFPWLSGLPNMGLDFNNLGPKIMAAPSSMAVESKGSTSGSNSPAYASMGVTGQPRPIFPVLNGTCGMSMGSPTSSSQSSPGQQISPPKTTSKPAAPIPCLFPSCTRTFSKKFELRYETSALPFDGQFVLMCLIWLC